MHHQVIGKSRLGIHVLLAAVLVAALSFWRTGLPCGAPSLRWRPLPSRPTPPLAIAIHFGVALAGTGVVLQPSALTGAGITTITTSPAPRSTHRASMTGSRRRTA